MNNHTYSRTEQATLPASIDSFKPDKYWPQVTASTARFGVRNLMCACSTRSPTTRKT